MKETSMPRMEIAIVEPNILTAMGLQGLFEEIIPYAVIRIFPSFADFVSDTPDMYTFCFISSQIYFEHTAFFIERGKKSIILTNGIPQPQLHSMMTLNMYQDQKGLVKELLNLHHTGHPNHHRNKTSVQKKEMDMLSAREIEVLVLLTKGLINKEIAEKLNISLTTVISHRKNIVEKLGIKSTPALAIYAVMRGYIDADQV